jgi:secreted trypsin-like serine protease
MVYLHKQTICPNETCSNGCSAILIDRDHLITAAHCIEMIDPIDIILIAGAHNLSSTTETAMRQLRTIKQIFFHPQYNSLTIENNIAVLRVNTSFIFTKYVQPACLSDDEIQSNNEVIVISWGGEQLRGTSNKILKQIYTTVVNNCNFYWPLYDTNRQLCVSNAISSNSACHDNESGAIFTLRRGQYVVDGIASYVKECNTKGKGHKPVVYTRISTFKTWINQIVELKDIK